MWRVSSVSSRSSGNAGSSVFLGDGAKQRETHTQANVNNVNSLNCTVQSQDFIVRESFFKRMHVVIILRLAT